MLGQIDTLKEEIAKLEASIDNATAHEFSWAPIWPFRDHISTSMRSEGEVVQAHTVWTEVGSQVHEQLFCNAFFGFGPGSADEIQEYIGVTEAVISAYTADQQPYVKGRPEENLFVPEFVPMFNGEGEPDLNRMRCHNFADSYTYPRKPVESVYTPFDVAKYCAEKDINLTGALTRNVALTAMNVQQLMARIAKEAANKDERQEVPEHANRYHWADGPRLRHERDQTPATST